MTIGVVVHTGKRLGGGPGALRSALADAGVTEPYWCEIPKSKKAPKHVRELLDAGVDRLLVWGGDGTVRRCIDTIVAENAKIEVAILPAGTANLLARAVEVPADLEQGRRHRRQWGPPTNRRRRHQWQGVRRDGRDGL